MQQDQSHCDTGCGALGGIESRSGEEKGQWLKWLDPRWLRSLALVGRGMRVLDVALRCRSILSVVPCRMHDGIVTAFRSAKGAMSLAPVANSET